MNGWLGSLGRAVRAAVHRFTGLLARFDVVDEKRGQETADLALPRMVTGFARQSQRTVDLIMVGVAVGPAGIAALALAAPFWSFAGGVGGGLSNGAIGLISQRYGAGRYDRMDVAIKQTVWLSLVIATPFTVGYWLYADWLVGLLGAGALATELGATYLRVVALAIGLSYLNKVAIRTLVSAGDSWIEMVIRVSAGVVNIVLTGLFIFGFGMGVFGAALGTVIARVLVTTSFTWGFLRGSHPGIGEFPVTLSLYPHVDATLIRQLIEVSLPLIIRRAARRVARFPLLAIVAGFGTVVVAGYGIARRAYALIRTPNWGFSLAASSLVGQSLGADEEAEAEAYGWDVLRYAVVIYVIIAAFVLAFARPIALVFSQDGAVVAAAVPFIRVMAVAAILYGVDGVAAGILQAGGDTRWPLYGRFIGLYGFTLPIAYLAVVTPLGLLALYLALLTEALVPGAITLYRVATGKWKVVSRRYRPEPTD